MRFVVAVAEERNFTRAAGRCHISQPALSRKVKEVEAALGIKLFERHTRSVSITTAGRLFVREARRTLQQGQRTVSLVRAFARREERPVAVGMSVLADLPRLHVLFEAESRTKKNPAFTVQTLTTPELLLALLRGDLDLAVMDLPARARGLRFVPLFSEPLVAVLPERAGRPKQSTVSFSELFKAPMALLSESVDPNRAVIERQIASAGGRAFRIREADGIPELLDQVAIDHRVGLVRESATRFQRQGVVYKSLTEPIPVGCALAWRAENRHPAVITLRDSILFRAQRMK